jgi:hypothetical protein
MGHPPLVDDHGKRKAGSLFHKKRCGLLYLNAWSESLEGVILTSLGRTETVRKMSRMCENEQDADSECRVARFLTIKV